MSRACDICGKGIQFGNQISHANNHTKRVWQPNLQRVHAYVEGRPMRIKVCTNCIKSGFVTKHVRKPGAGTTKTPTA